MQERKWKVQRRYRCNKTSYEENYMEKLVSKEQDARLHKFKSSKNMRTELSDLTS